MLFGLPGQRSDNVIGFVAINLQDGDVKSFQYFFHFGQAVAYVFGCFLPGCFVGFKNFIAESGC